jgi:MSHA biogenesis protein MshP
MCPRISFKFRVSSFKLRESVGSYCFADSQLATRNSKLRSAQRGFSIVTAIFLVVVLALLGAFIVSVTGLQQSSTQLDMQGVRAYHAARAGVEWAAFQILTPVADTPPACPTSPTHITGLGGSLSTFTVTVTCTETGVITESNRNVRTYRIVSDACNEPAGGVSCPGGASPLYVDRQIEVVLSRCNDPTAGPRFACG